MRDQDPGVIRNLLHNPRVTESEVLKLASRNPVSPRILEEVAYAERWISRYRLKLALVLNPCTPRNISTLLLGLLMVQDLPRVMERQQLPIVLRRHARKLRQERWEEVRGGTSGDLE